MKKMQYDNNREADKYDKYEQILNEGEQILPSNQSRIIEQANLHILFSLKHLKNK